MAASPAVGSPLPHDAPAWVSPFPADVAFAAASAADAAGVALHPAEQALLSPRAAPRRVLEFTLGRGCARRALAALDAALADAAILRADARRPAWPAGIVGAITHHHGLAAAAAADSSAYRGVGVDLEAVRSPTAGLLRRILRPEEREQWQALPPAERALAFTVAFSVKESIFKALYPAGGVFLGFQDASVALPASAGGAVFPSAGPGPLTWELREPAGAAAPAGYRGQAGYVIRGGFVLTGVWVPCQGAPPPGRARRRVSSSR